ncbi:unnamed protein product [Mytilus coruscus]|uniref:Uncharacterized protein n=1 Tax=Mytilus coruscus TaxID=42192 RepID=A0A6J8ARD4_MYTCO|nr:unnamed protein product [Mytilus coruscus]
MAMGYSKLIYKVTTRCPTRVERRLQNSHWSRTYCSSVNVYHCIRDERDNLVATCNKPVQIPLGNYPIYLHRSDKIHYERCPKHLYQPFPVWSYEISDCEYEKSSCNGIGQILCGNGNTTADSTCGCDYKKGYVINSQTKCCSPSRLEECYCQYHTCENNLQELDADFKCINKCMDGYERSPQNICEQISDTAKSKPSRDVSTTFEPILLPGSFSKPIVYREHRLINDPEVYNEEYDIRSFRLLTAAANGNLDEMRRLRYEDYIDMDVVDINSRSALHLAACEGQNDVLNYIFRHNFCFLEAKDRWNRSAEDDTKWHQKHRQYKKEARDEDYEETLFILKTYKNKNINKQRKEPFKERKTLQLLTAARKGDLRTIKRLRELGTDMDLANYSGQTALHAAVEMGMEEIVDYLIKECEVSPFVRWRGKRPLDIVLAHGKHEKKKFVGKLQSYISDLLEFKAEEKVHKVKPSEEYMIVRLLSCASRGDIKQMKLFKAQGYTMDLKNYDSQTALHIAVIENQEEIVEFLLQECNQIDIGKTHKDRRVRLSIAVKLLISVEYSYKPYIRNKVSFKCGDCL